jgi:hypothetical protein
MAGGSAIHSSAFALPAQIVPTEIEGIDVW